MCLSTSRTRETRRAGGCRGEHYLGEDREGREYWQVGSGVCAYPPPPPSVCALLPPPPSRVCPLSSPSRHQSRCQDIHTRNDPQPQRSQNQS